MKSPKFTDYLHFTLASKASIFLALMTLLPNFAHAEVSLAKVFADSMVIQRDMPINVWGKAKAGETIKVQLAGLSKSVVGNAQGEWLVSFPSQSINVKQTLMVTSTNTITVSDIAFGDVWLASGQSNMQFPLIRTKPMFPEEFNKDTYPDIRQFLIPKTQNFANPQQDFSVGHWQKANAKSIEKFSAVAWFFAKELNVKYQVPIGIINASVGGTPIESWMSYESLEKYPHTQALAYKLRDLDYVKQIKHDEQQIDVDWQSNLTAADLGLKGQPWYSTDHDINNWHALTVPGKWLSSGVKFNAGVIWLKKQFTLSKEQSMEAIKLQLGHFVDADKTYLNGHLIGQTSHRYAPRNYIAKADTLNAGINTITMRVEVKKGSGASIKGKTYQLMTNSGNINLKGTWQYKIGAHSTPVNNKSKLHVSPVGLYNAMINPMKNMKFKGVVWYQGEGNVNKSATYADQFATMITDWRSLVQQPDLPFLFVQLANFQKANLQPVESLWAQLRNAQTQVLKTIHNTGMAVTIDVGAWNDIHPLDKRTVGKRLALNARHIAYGETELNYLSPMIKSGRATGNKVTLDFDYIDQHLVVKGDELKGFAIAGEDKQYVWANAKLENDKVIVWNESIQVPKYVRYAWANNPDKANLFNVQGLPVTPFTVKVP